MVARAVAADRVIRLFPRQRRFVLDPGRRPAYVGGIGSGKTFAGACKVIARIDRPNERGMVVAPTFDILRMATLDTLFLLMAHAGLVEGRDYGYNKNEKEITVRNGHRIVCRSAERYENLRGPNLAYAWVDEAALIDGEAWRIVKGRVRTGHNPQTWVTTTPKGRNWIWQEWERDAAPDHPLYRVTTDENPELPPGFAASLGYEGAFAEQELAGLFVAFEGLVYPWFRRDLHVKAVDCEGWGAVVALDIGTRNPTAVLTIRHAGDRLHVEHEAYRRGLGTAAVLDATEAACRAADAEYVVIDPSAAAYEVDLRDRGLKVRKGQNAVIPGLQRVASVAGSLTVDPSCVNTISEFESYQYPKGAGNVERDVPVKANDHALDALRYAVMELVVPPKQPIRRMGGEAAARLASWMEGA